MCACTIMAACMETIVLTIDYIPMPIISSASLIRDQIQLYTAYQKCFLRAAYTTA